MTRSELLQLGISLSKSGMQEPNESNFFHGNVNEDIRALNALGFELFLAEQKRSDGGCGICGGLEKLAEGEKTDPIPLYSNGKIYAKVCFVREEGVIWHRVVIGVNSYRVKMHWCSNCGRDLTEGESV